MIRQPTGDLLTMLEQAIEDVHRGFTLYWTEMRDHRIAEDDYEERETDCCLVIDPDDVRDIIAALKAQKSEAPR